MSMTAAQRKLAILNRAREQGNNKDKRLERRNLLNALRNEVEEWLAVLDQRGHGPTPEELSAILKELSEGVLHELNIRAAPDSIRIE